MKARLTMTGHARGELFLDDKKVEGVRSVSIEVGTDRANVLKVECLPSVVEIEGEFDVQMRDSTIKELLRIGDEPQA